MKELLVTGLELEALRNVLTKFRQQNAINPLDDSILTGIELKVTALERGWK